MSAVPSRGRLRPPDGRVRLPVPPPPVPRVASTGGTGRTWIPGVTSPAYAPQADPSAAAVPAPAAALTTAVRGAVSTMLLAASLGVPVLATVTGLRLVR